VAGRVDGDRARAASGRTPRPRLPRDDLPDQAIAQHHARSGVRVQREHAIAGGVRDGPIARDIERRDVPGEDAL
jgi:hypothetical protein